MIMLGPTRAVGQPQSKDQQKCTVAMNKALLKVATTRGKGMGACIADGSKGTLAGTIESCLTADADGKVAKAVAKSQEKFTKLCTGTSKKDPASPKLPPYGVTDPLTLESTATEKELALLHDIFGLDLDTAIVRMADDGAAAKCQQTVAKQASKCEASQLKAFIACKQRGLKDKVAPFDGAEDLEACMGADPKGKIAKKCDLREPVPDGKVDSIRKALDKKCQAKRVSLAAAFPGCAGGDLEQTHACVETAVECRVCLALNRADGLARDCDSADDGAVNGSCVRPFVIGRHQCVLTPETSGFLFETAQFFDGFLLTGAVDIDCGAVDPMTGKAACACTLARMDPVPIVPGLGIACVRPAPGCSAGEISCNGGDLYNSAITSTHGIGSCTSNADCGAQCAATCASSGALVFDSGCEGFCRRGGSDGSACSADTGCPGGTCNGLDGAPHGNLCQCECLDRAGDPSLAGGLRCNVGVDIEVEAAAPCGDGDVLFRIGDRCVPFTTETTQAVIVAANNVAGERIPAGQEITTGLPLACTSLAANGPSGLFLAGAVNIFDVERAGDIAFIFFLGCE